MTCLVYLFCITSVHRGAGCVNYIDLLSEGSFGLQLSGLDSNGGLKEKRSLIILAGRCPSFGILQICWHLCNKYKLQECFFSLRNS